MPPAGREPMHVHRDDSEILHVELEDLEDARIRSELLAGRREVGALALATVIILLAILAAAMLAAPRAASDTVLSGPSSSPELPGAPRSPQAAEDIGAPLVPRWAGTATWYCSSSSPCTRGHGPSDLVAAIDSDLGIPKGSTVVVRAFGRAVTVRIVDVCACAGQRLIDLTSGAFRRLAPLEAGVIAVTIEVVEVAGTLPPTGTQPR